MAAPKWRVKPQEGSNHQTREETAPATSSTASAPAQTVGGRMGRRGPRARSGGDCLSQDVHGEGAGAGRNAGARSTGTRHDFSSTSTQPTVAPPPPPPSSRQTPSNRQAPAPPPPPPPRPQGATAGVSGSRAWLEFNPPTQEAARQNEDLQRFVQKARGKQARHCEACSKQGCHTRGQWEQCLDLEKYSVKDEKWDDQVIQAQTLLGGFVGLNYLELLERGEEGRLENFKNSELCARCSAWNHWADLYSEILRTRRQGFAKSFHLKAVLDETQDEPDDQLISRRLRVALRSLWKNVYCNCKVVVVAPTPVAAASLWRLLNVIVPLMYQGAPVCAGEQELLKKLKDDPSSNPYGWCSLAWIGKNGQPEPAEALDQFVAGAARVLVAPEALQPIPECDVILKLDLNQEYVASGTSALEVLLVEAPHDPRHERSSLGQLHRDPQQMPFKHGARLFNSASAPHSDTYSPIPAQVGSSMPALTGSPMPVLAGATCTSPNAKHEPNNRATRTKPKERRRTTPSPDSAVKSSQPGSSMFEEVEHGFSTSRHIHATDQIEQINEFCRSLPRDSLTPKSWDLITCEPASASIDGGTGHVAKIRLPPACPLREDITSDPRPRKDEAKYQVTQRCIELLNQKNLLKSSKNLDTEESNQNSKSAIYEGASEDHRSAHPQINPPSKLFEALRALHHSDFSENVEWPGKLRLLHILPILPASEDADAPRECTGHSFGLLLWQSVHPRPVEFGLSLATPNGAARFVPHEMIWRRTEELEKAFPDAEDPKVEAEELLRLHHEAVMSSLFPDDRPPMPALLVRLRVHGDQSRSPSLAWSQMQRYVSSGTDMIEKDYKNPNTQMDTMQPEAQPGGMEPEGEPCMDAHTNRELGGDMGMEGEPLPPEDWFGPLLSRWSKLHDLEEMALQKSPVSPVLNPLALEASLMQPESGEDAREVLVELGRCVLRLLIGTKVQLENLYDDERQLIQKRESFMDSSRLSSLMRNSMIPVQGDEHGRALLALLAAYFCTDGGGLRSAWRLWQWLQPRDLHGADESAASEPAALSFHLFGARKQFLGRTPSYTEFHEVLGEHGEIVLKVHYEDRGWMEYRRQIGNCKQPEERRADVPGCPWEPVRFRPTEQTYMSGFMLNDTGENWPLPNKVVHWLCFKPVASLATVKHYMGRTPDYLQLQERENGELWVWYKESGWWAYLREDGGIGEECRISFKENGEVEWGPRYRLKYSERMKTFKSFMLDEPLPNKVVEFLRFRSLALFAVARHVKQEDGCGRESSMQVETVTEDKVRWFHRGREGTREFTCYVHKERGGIVFIEQEKDHEPEALLYSEELKSWLSPTLTREQRAKAKAEDSGKGATLPPGVVDWLKRAAQRATKPPSLSVDHVRQQRSRAPWCAVPAYIRQLIPPQLDIPMLEGQVLKHDYEFRDPTLLVEALTHSSYTDAMTSSCERLALQGSELVEVLMFQALIDKAEFPISGQRRAGEEGRPGLGQSQHTYAVAWLPGDAQQWPKDGPATNAGSWLNTGLAEKDATSSVHISTAKQLLQWKNACCNHVTYARACVSLRLHECILHKGEQLSGMAQDFANAFRKAEEQCRFEISRELINHDAPRVLGDIFLAVAGAVLLDSDWNTAVRVLQPLLKAHILDSILNEADEKGAPRAWADPIAQAEQQLAEQNRLFTVQECRAEQGQLESHPSLAIDAARKAQARKVFVVPGEEKDNWSKGDSAGGRGAEKNTVKVLFQLRDFHLVEPRVDGEPAGPPVCGTSPRSAKRQCAWQYLLSTGKVHSDPANGIVGERLLPVPGGGEQPKQVARKEVSGNNALTDPTLPAEVSAKSSTNAQSENPKQAIEDDKMDAGKSIYCQDCKMWVNGPEQWRDHRNGKKHRKQARARSACGPQEEVTKDKLAASKKTDSQRGGSQLNTGHSPSVEGKGVKEQGSLRERSADSEILDGVGNRFLEQPHGEVGEPPPSAGKVAASTEVPATTESCGRGNALDDDSGEHESMSQISQPSQAVAGGDQQYWPASGEQSMHMTGQQWGNETWSSRSRMHQHPRGYDSRDPSRGMDPYWSYQEWNPGKGWRPPMGMRRMSRMGGPSGKNHYSSMSNSGGGCGGHGSGCQWDDGVWPMHSMPMGPNMPAGMHSHWTYGMGGPMPWQMCPSGMPPRWNSHHNWSWHPDEGGPHMHEGWESQGLPSAESGEQEPAEEVTSTEIATQ